ncbi:Threonine efflux protein (Modular protein) [Vibrio chagasii]|uniref:LysE family translocator n=1 Tax=Vibrio chagasii TaxID=170679 RepID=UPI001EFE6289|nr:LysE family translocator [Vibrio chagasii]MCG9676634.1 LysE family translocator [Vibrio chagasii]CAH7250662.1 Threonine efflux protein (Modular protein) [Vibrio chagasii]CAH7252494.1 Threonine efflux protein (Modular protein) [Vibrio chagasii]CAH7452236.1 Threonine efflux protein (Modular protein) [Vibrio chagasii]
MDHSSLVAFTIAAILLNISPGPSLIFVSARGVSEGKAAGAVSALGLATGSSLHAILAGLGVTAIVASNDSIATIISVAGGLYVAFLGFDAFRTAKQKLTYEVQKSSKNTLRKIYLQAISVEFLNPKTILFYLSILPGLIITSGYNSFEAVFVSLIVPATALPIDMFAGLTGGMLSNISKRNVRLTIILNYLSGTALLLIGIGLIYNNIW